MTSPKWDGVIGGHKWQLRAPTAVAAWASLQAQFCQRPIPKENSGSLELVYGTPFVKYAKLFSFTTIDVPC